ncbi:HAD family hydrolase [Paludibacterium yongneupense]|uniref:HAD family hydrolase n=1 Tax=Paludibacterium yongneupense TaxID=400061 RepID=UPI000420242A|nr:HAD-IA family hydrolase [Paludibacterium yongneupense]
MSTIDVLLFDMGGVLVHWDGTTPLVELTAGRLDREQARRFWLTSPWVARHDLGLCTLHEFAAGAIEELQLDIDTEAFIARYTGWVSGAYPGIPELLATLGRRFRLASLTNNNAAHYDHIAADFGIVEHFQTIFASHLIGMKKPDRNVYRHVTTELGVEPARIAFFDDNPECLQPAREIGWQTFLTRGPDELRATLIAQGWLD